VPGHLASYLGTNFPPFVCFLHFFLLRSYAEFHAELVGFSRLALPIAFGPRARARLDFVGPLAMNSWWADAQREVEQRAEAHLTRRRSGDLGGVCRE